MDSLELQSPPTDKPAAPSSSPAHAASLPGNSPQVHVAVDAAVVTAGGDAEPARQVEQHRTVPCMGCRRIRRVCRWIRGQRGCERCVKGGLVCSGPQRRGRIALGDADGSASAPSLEPEDVQRVALSGAAKRWMDTHLSYSLASHLVATCLDYAPSMPFALIQLDTIAQDLLDTRGKLAEPSPENEACFLLASIYMVFGAQFCNHTAIVGSAPQLPSLSDLTELSQVRCYSHLNIGERRQRALFSLADILLKKVEAVDLRDGEAEELLARILLVWMAIEPLMGLWEGERHRLFGLLIEPAVAVLEALPASSETSLSAEDAQFMLQGLARQEIRHSLAHNRPSSITPAFFHALLGQPDASVPFTALPADLTDTFIFNAAPVPGELPEATLHDMYATWDVFLDCAVYPLLYAAGQHLPAAVQFCWQQLDRLEEHLFQDLLHTLHHPDLDALPPSQRGRPVDHAYRLFLPRLLILGALQGCLHALVRGETIDELVQEAEERVVQELNGVFEHAEALLVLLDHEPVRCYSLVTRVVIVLDSFDEAFWPSWARSNPSTCEILLNVLRIASFFMPEASRLCTVLETGDDLRQDLPSPNWLTPEGQSSPGEGGQDAFTA